MQYQIVIQRWSYAYVILYHSYSMPSICHLCQSSIINKSFSENKFPFFFITFYLSTIYLTIYSTNSINHVIGLLTLFPHHNTQNIPFIHAVPFLSLYAFSIKITFPTTTISNLMILSYKDNTQQHPQKQHSTTEPSKSQPLTSSMHAAENPLMYPTCTLARFSEFPRNSFLQKFCHYGVQTRPTKRYTFPECENEKKNIYIYIQRLRRQVHITRTFHPHWRRCYGTIKADYW